VALAAREHGIPFYTATTRYNVDVHCHSGQDIPIEFRAAREVLFIDDRPITIEGVQAHYPAFDITPAELLTGIVTEGGLFVRPFEEKLLQLVGEEGWGSIRPWR
jgi:methylthioribose-1-phosphate isomerase